MKGLLGFVRKLIRFNNWWSSKASSLLAFAYLGILILAIPPLQALIKLGILVIWIAGAASFGHFVNDWFDGLHDERAGKENLVSGLNTPWRYLAFIVLLAVMVIPICLYSHSTIVAALIAIHVLLFLLYSHPAVRLKESPIGGILIDSLYAHLVPALIVLYFFNFSNDLNGYMKSFAAIWLISQGCRNVLLHQISDESADKKTGAKTFVTVYGSEKAFYLINRLLIPFEITSFIICNVIISQTCYGLAVPIIFLYFLLKAPVQSWEWFSRQQWLNTNHPSFSILNNLYEQVLPLIFLVALVKCNIVFVALLVLHLLLFYSSTWQMLLTVKHFVKVVYYKAIT